MPARWLRLLSELAEPAAGGRLVDGLAAVVRGREVDGAALLRWANRDLAALVSEERLRKDLHYRLAGCTLHIPPLRKCPADVAALVEHFLDRAAEEAGKEVAGMTVKVLRALGQAPWPGNVRQLVCKVRRLVHLCPDGDAVDPPLRGRDLATFIAASAGPPPLGGDLDLRPQLE